MPPSGMACAVFRSHHSPRSTTLSQSVAWIREPALMDDDSCIHFAVADRLQMTVEGASLVTFCFTKFRREQPHQQGRRREARRGWQSSFWRPGALSECISRHDQRTDPRPQRTAAAQQAIAARVGGRTAWNDTLTTSGSPASAARLSVSMSSQALDERPARSRCDPSTHGVKMNVSLGQGRIRQCSERSNSQSLSYQVFGVFVVFVADEFEQLGICRKAQIHGHGPGPAICRRIVDGYADIHVAEVPALEELMTRNLSLIG